MYKKARIRYTVVVRRRAGPFVFTSQGGEADAQGGIAPTNINMTGHACQIADLANAILNNTKPVMDMYEGRRAVELICGIYESAKTGQPYIFEKK